MQRKGFGAGGGSTGVGVFKRLPLPVKEALAHKKSEW